MKTGEDAGSTQESAGRRSTARTPADQEPARTPKQIATAAVIAWWPGVTAHCTATELGDILERWLQVRTEGPIDRASDASLLDLAARCLLQAHPELAQLENRAAFIERLRTWAQNQIQLSRQNAIGEDATEHRRGG